MARHRTNKQRKEARARRAAMIPARVRRCRYCGREMTCPPLEYEQNPFCTACLPERVARARRARRARAEFFDSIEQSARQNKPLDIAKRAVPQSPQLQPPENPRKGRIRPAPPQAGIAVSIAPRENTHGPKSSDSKT